MTPEVNTALDGKGELRGFPTVETESLIADFDAGRLIFASLAGSDQTRPDLERLRDLDEVWALCVRKPRPWQVRILGRFLDQGIFIGLAAHQRLNLGAAANYHQMASYIPAAWRQCLGSAEPYRAASVEEYLGGVWRDVDEQ